MRCAVVILVVGLPLVGCGRGEPYVGNGTVGGSTGGRASGGATSTGGGATTGSSAGSGSTTAASTGSAATGGNTGVSTAGGFTPNTELVVEQSSVPGNSLLAVVIGDFAGGPLSCGQLADGGPTGQFVILEIYQPGSPNGVQVGSYPVVPVSTSPFDAGSAAVLEGQGFLDAGVVLVAEGVSGVVNLTELDVGSAALGNLTAVMFAADGGTPLGTISGNFDASWCGMTP
jgi:hypothetical protein